MENNNSNWNFNAVQQPQVGQQPIAKTFMASVFSWMGIALAISAVTAYVFGTDMSYMSYLINPETGGMTWIQPAFRFRSDRHFPFVFRDHGS